MSAGRPPTAPAKQRSDPAPSTAMPPKVAMAERLHRRAILATPSPIMPPSPVGSGQRSVAGSSEATPAAQSVAASHRRRRQRIRSTRRWRSRRQPQIATGSSRTMQAMPIVCVTRSAATAPREPSRLRTGPLVA